MWHMITVTYYNAVSLANCENWCTSDLWPQARNDSTWFHLLHGWWYCGLHHKSSCHDSKTCLEVTTTGVYHQDGYLSPSFPSSITVTGKKFGIDYKINSKFQFHYYVQHAGHVTCHPHVQQRIEPNASCLRHVSSNWKEQTEMHN